MKKITPLLITISLIVLFYLGYGAPSAIAYTEEQKILLQSWRIINQAYIDDSFNHQNWWFLREKYLKNNLQDREDTYQTIETMLSSLNDPYTRLLRPEQYRSLQVNTAGELSGVGLQINVNNDTGDIEVVAPLAGSPAETAGIKPRDRILAINGTSTKNLTLDEAAAKMRGVIGTKVKLVIQSPDTSEQRILDLVRDRIPLNPVYAKLDDTHTPPIGYIRLQQFSANAAKETAHAVSSLQQLGAKAFILDLRNNPGGLLQAGIEVARLWLNRSTVVYTVNRQGVLDSFDAFGTAITEAPLVVLVNQGTASASEILAGALQDNNRAVLVGEKTFGKGLIQSLFELPDGAGLAVTVAKYETPHHTDINKRGIIPDINVPQPDISWQELTTDKDFQYQKALNNLWQQLDV